MDTLLLEVCRFVVVFFLFAVAGWCMEVTLKFIGEPDGGERGHVF